MCLLKKKKGDMPVVDTARNEYAFFALLQKLDMHQQKKKSTNKQNKQKKKKANK